MPMLRIVRIMRVHKSGSAADGEGNRMRAQGQSNRGFRLIRPPAQAARAPSPFACVIERPDTPPAIVRDGAV